MNPDQILAYISALLAFIAVIFSSIKEIYEMCKCERKHIWRGKSKWITIQISIALISLIVALIAIAIS